jgi:hypothetical protein
MGGQAWADRSWGERAGEVELGQTEVKEGALGSGI